MPTPKELEEGRIWDGFAADTRARHTKETPFGRFYHGVVEAVSDLEPDRLIDIGCGNGMMLRDLSPHTGFGLGVDVSGRMLEIARSVAEELRLENLEFAKHGFSDLKTLADNPDSRFDVVMSVYAMHHLESDEKREAVEGMCCAAREGGVVVLGDLMFFEDPSQFTEPSRETGFLPDSDKPERVETLVGWFEANGMKVTVESFHPLIGIIVAKRA